MSYPEIAFFNLSTILAATNSFSPANKLGQGGFGVVYKGKLSNGKEVAVKRLSKDSRQGIDEFKNEVLLIAKLQHQNLVKLIGCCIQGEEPMLVYEYMPNKSLDWTPFFSIWHLWREERAWEIIDSSLKHSCSPDEVLRCIQIGLLCVQEDVLKRPTISAIVLMLNSEISLPSPKQPAFTFRKSSSLEPKERFCSVDEEIITEVICH
ncbi:cysteine-rich receptor-like protein kinase 8 isoform X1 [Hevea brasiliensis]|uniref:cysteine-rich receptor-like protein kinase 8 isoform X1 n=1 Tax=Hevea brasiliensis TaxID=3981 RepID=UPI0025ECA63A|nr:cysteine-rich receptor-like protein kinase 8 isoform X1 [Hevea brasiliensis]